MIIKKRKISLKAFKIINNLFSRIIYLLGIFALSLLIIISIYYLNSGMKKNFPPNKLIQKIDKTILNKYVGFSIFELDDYFLIRLKSLKYLFLENDLENIKISINQENLYILESQRKSRLEDENFQFDSFADARIEQENEKFRVKLRLKGDRSIHWSNKNKTSYKIDLKGEKRLWGLEEFSIQKPVTRNYIYEFIFHKLLEFNNLISLKYFFVNLKVNDTNQGIYAVEEGFSKELIERNKKRNGPIFGLNEEDGITYPNIFYDLYSEDYWFKNYPNLTKDAFAKLNLVKNNQAELNEFFDLEKWAKFFAVIDFSNALHGSLSKSVKLYYNPTTGKFEPIGFDGHYYELNPANEFIILDFLNPNNNKCNHVCYDRSWYLKFLKKLNGDVNHEFVDLYLKELKDIASDTFLNDFKKKHLKKINFYNSQFFSEKSEKDRALYKGLGYYIFNKEYLDERTLYIKKRIADITSNNTFKITLDNEKIKFFSKNNHDLKKIVHKCKNGKNDISYIFPNSYIKFDKNCDYLINNKKILITEISDLNSNFKKKNYFDLTTSDDLIFKNDKYFLTKDLIINKNTFFPKKNSLVISEGVKISFNKKSMFVSNGSIFFEGNIDNPIIIEGNKLGSIIFNSNYYKIKGTNVQNLSTPFFDDRILHGGINIINSNIEISNLNIKDSASEDAINIISSNSIINNLSILNAFSDGVDIDFGKINFNEIYCSDIKNDCFDVSGSKVEGTYLEANNVSDKGISFGENSMGHIDFVNLKKNRLAIAVKDGSELSINESELEENEFDVSVFKKKMEFGNAKLTMHKSNKSKDLNILIGFNNDFIFNKYKKINKVDNEYIYNLFY